MRIIKHLKAIAATIAVAAVPAFALATPAGAAENAIGLATDNTLVSVPTADPASATVSTITFPVTSTDTDLVGLDYRPRGGGLYAVATGGTFYVLTPGTTAGTFAATQIDPTPLIPEYDFDSIGFDFNPAPDAIRLVTSDGDDYRFSPNNGNLLGTDTDLAYAPGDPNAGDTPQVTGAAYTNSKDGTGAMGTTLYDIDSNNDRLVTQGSPNATPVSPNTGQLFTVGSLDVDTTGNVGFDIAPASGEAYAAFELAGSTGSSSLYDVNPSTGGADEVGEIGGGKVLEGLSVVPASVVSFASSSISVDERAGTAEIVVVRTGGLNREVTVDYTVSGGGATEAGGTLTFPVNSARQTFEVPVTVDQSDTSGRVIDLTLQEAGPNAIVGEIGESALNVIDYVEPVNPPNPPAPNTDAPIALISVSTTKIGQLTRGKVRVQFSCDKACGTSMNLKLGGKRIGSATASLAKAGKRTATIKLNAASRKLVKKKAKGKKSLKLNLAATFTADGSPSAKQSLAFRVTR